MSIAGKRFQQGVFEALASVNRAAGSGGGSGYRPMFTLVDQYTAPTQAFTGIGSANAVDLTGSAATFQVTRATDLLIMSRIWMAVTAGADFFYAYVDFDGTGVATALSGDGTRGYYTAAVWGVVAAVQPGSHTVKVRGYVGAGGTTGTIIQAETFVLPARELTLGA